MRGGRIGSLLLGLALATGVARPQDATPHVALISIDGLRPADYLDGGPCGPAPRHLSELMRAGLYAEGVAGVLPSLTYPSHATIVTGVVPNRHGVLANARPRDGAPWYFDRSDIHATTLWDAARRAGRTVAIVTWPSTYGADVNDLIPENLSSLENVTDLVRNGSTPGLFATLESATGPVRLLPFNDPEAGIPLDRMTAAFAAAIVRRDRPDLLLIHFLDLDHREHAAGPGSDEACRALGRIDGLVGQVRDAYREAGLLGNTSFVIVSDHGFLPVHTVVNLTALLSQTGWAGIEKDLEIRPAEGSASFYPRKKSDPALLKRVETELRPRVERRMRGLVRWIPRDEARRMGGFEGAAFALCASPGYMFGVPSAHATAPATSTSTSNSILQPAERRGTHGYCPDETAMDAAFLAAGPGIRRLGAIPRIRMIDIAPTLAALLGIALPDADGLPIAGLLTESSGR